MNGYSRDEDIVMVEGAYKTPQCVVRSSLTPRACLDIKREIIVNFLLGVVLVSSCTNEQFTDPPSMVSQAETPDIVLNVNEAVEDFDSFVSKLRSAGTIKLVTPDFTRIVKNNGADSCFQAEGSERLLLSNDSISMILLVI